MTLKAKKKLFTTDLPPFLVRRRIGQIELVERTSGIMRQTTPPNWVESVQLVWLDPKGHTNPEKVLTRGRSTKYAVAVTDVYVSLLAASMGNCKEVELRVTAPICLKDTPNLNVPRAFDIYRQPVTDPGKILFPKVIVATGFGSDFEEAALALTQKYGVRVEFEMVLDGISVGWLAAVFYPAWPHVITPES